MRANADGVVTEADIRAAQAALDELLQMRLDNAGTVPLIRREDAQEVRGYLAGWSGEVRTAGYLEGLQEGRRQVSRWVRDTLEGEGL